MDQSAVQDRQKVIVLLAERVLAFQKILAFNRRLSAQRIRRRQQVLRTQYFQRMLDLQTQLLLQIPRPVEKRYWTEDRHSDWWELEAKLKFSDEKWLDTFRVSRQAFAWLCEVLANDLTPRCTVMRKPISLEKRIAMSLYKLASGIDYRSVANLFAVARSTVCKFVMMFCRAIDKKFRHEQIFMPDVDEFRLITQNFEEVSKLPHICGSIGTTHFPLNTSGDHNVEFGVFALRSSYVFQAIIDNQMIFRKVAVNSNTFFSEVTNELPKVCRIVGETTISPYLIGKPSYPLLPFITKKYRTPSNGNERNFNICVDEARAIADEALRRLNGRWGILNKRTDVEHRNMDLVIDACCVLHNILERKREGYNESWANDLNGIELDTNHKSQSKIADTEEGRKLRSALTSHLMNI